MQRENKQPTFIDLAVSHCGGPRTGAFLDTCNANIPFDLMAQSVSDIFKADTGKGGAPHWPLPMMIRIMFLQKVYGLSDPAMEEMLLDRVSFRRFLGLSLDDKTPDHSTLCRFRKRLIKAGHAETLFDQTLAHLEKQGLVLKNGTLIDASIMEAPRGGVNKNGDRTTDPCGTKTAKHNRGYFGYRVHTATDRRGVITKYIYDTASVSEHEHFDTLAEDEKKAVFADSGCRSKDRVDRLRERGVVAGICHRRVRGQKELTPEQKRFNKIVAPIRAFVEHPYAWIKGRLNNRRVRYRGLAANAFDFAMSAIAWNFCRSFSLRSAVALVR